jgi:hypothetical protein
VIDPGQVQHVNLKIFVESAADVDLADSIAVFHRWIRESVCPEMLIDVADYRHVFGGPGILLIGHEANYSLDNRDNRLGLLYNRKTVLEGALQSRLEQAHGAALDACARLESDAAFHGKLRFNRNAMEVSVNDRLLAPNTAETFDALRPALEKVFPGYTIARTGEPRDLFRVSLSKL